MIVPAFWWQFPQLFQFHRYHKHNSVSNFLLLEHIDLWSPCWSNLQTHDLFWTSNISKLLFQEKDIMHFLHPGLNPGFLAVKYYWIVKQKFFLHLTLDPFLVPKTATNAISFDFLLNSFSEFLINAGVFLPSRSQ